MNITEYQERVILRALTEYAARLDSLADALQDTGAHEGVMRTFGSEAEECRRIATVFGKTL